MTVKNRTQCPECLDSGSDNLINYHDGGSHCFACGYHTGGSDSIAPHTGDECTMLTGTYQDLKGRSISAKTCEFFDYEVGEDKEGAVHIANYYSGTELVGQKVRGKGKRFYVNGNATSLFGMDKYEPSKNTFVTITEGEIDALSIAEVQGTRFPVVSVPNGAQGATMAVKRNLKWLNGFKHMVICFDMDEAGREAAKEISQLFEPGFARIAKLPCKDANEMLMTGKRGEITGCLFNAQAMRPDGIIKLSEITESEITEALQPGVSIKYPKLDNMLNGLRKQSLYTIMARAKSGKTTLTKEIVLDLVNKGTKVGVLYLEEDAVAEALSFIAMEDETPQWKFMDRLTEHPDMMEGVKERLKTYEDRGLYLYNHKGVIDAESVFNTVNYMVKALDCEIIVLDNISISIAGTDVAANERKLIDRMVYDLVKLINNTKCTILTVVHVNQKGEAEEKLTRKDVFGSGAFLKFSRGLIAIDKTEEGLVQLSVLGNRAKGLEGNADTLEYNAHTGRLDIHEDLV